MATNGKADEWGQTNLAANQAWRRQIDRRDAKSAEGPKQLSDLGVIESAFGRSQRYGETGALDGLSGNWAALSGLGNFVNGCPRASLADSALPWAILFEAFSLSKAEFAIPECGMSVEENMRNGSCAWELGPIAPPVAVRFFPDSYSERVGVEIMVDQPERKP